MTTWKEAKRQLHEENPELKREYGRLGPRFAAISALIAARNEAHLSQSELARRMSVPPGTISRFESAQHSPRLDTLVQYAEALGYEFRLQLVPGHVVTPARGARRRSGRRTAAGTSASSTRGRKS
jgi:DNA-binding XRE family transcriptional regulator